MHTTSKHSAMKPKKQIVLNFFDHARAFHLEEFRYYKGPAFDMWGDLTEELGTGIENFIRDKLCEY